MPQKAWVPHWLGPSQRNPTLTLGTLCNIPIQPGRTKRQEVKDKMRENQLPAPDIGNL